jgi:hypothetical protein
MKTTIDLSDALAHRARELAAREGTTLRALVEDGLRRVLQERERQGFRLREASVGGRGMRPEFETAGWDRIRDALYEPETGE